MEQDNAEDNVEGSEAEEDLYDEWKPLVYNRWGAAVESLGESEGVIAISDSSFGNEAQFVHLNEELEQIDISG